MMDADDPALYDTPSQQAASSESRAPQDARLTGEPSNVAIEAVREQARHYAPFTPLTDEEVKRGAAALQRELGEWGSDRMHAQWARIVLGNAEQEIREALGAPQDAPPAGPWRVFGEGPWVSVVHAHGRSMVLHGMAEAVAVRDALNRVARESVTVRVPTFDSYDADGFTLTFE